MSTPSFPPSSEFAANAHVDSECYETTYAASMADPEAFWARLCGFLGIPKPSPPPPVPRGNAFEGSSGWTPTRQPGRRRHN